MVRKSIPGVRTKVLELPVYGLVLAQLRRRGAAAGCGGPAAAPAVSGKAIPLQRIFRVVWSRYRVQQPSIGARCLAPFLGTVYRQGYCPCMALKNYRWVHVHAGVQLQLYMNMYSTSGGDHRVPAAGTCPNYTKKNDNYRFVRTFSHTEFDLKTRFDRKSVFGRKVENRGFVRKRVILNTTKSSKAFGVTCKPS